MKKSAALFLLMGLMSGCSDGCQNSAVSTTIAPTGKLKAVLFERSCGATTGFSSQVSLVQATDEPAGPGNVFVADTDRGAASAASWGGPWTELHWLSPHELLVRYDAKARVFANNGRVSGVAVKYEKAVR
ncbi:hypothetical protein G7078_00310 [Sphingomonas sinipercae]|uniref:Lipoprotein n=1 Tax=Sphingomonas sinipercae TaxID=2714944 RepID=A0A6G7ZK67_9SPHN|nr:hypothetical protein [Sphingomonas sinipercae]QIL01387.1 hypothetical protein G7078_00310 [Sphingomonas sinipercae]